MFCIYTEVIAQDDTVNFLNKTTPHFQLSPMTHLCVRMTSPNYAFMRCRLYSKQKSYYTLVYHVSSYSLALHISCDITCTIESFFYCHAKSDNDVILCLHLLSKALMCALHLS